MNKGGKTYTRQFKEQAMDLVRVAVPFAKAPACLRPADLWL